METETLTGRDAAEAISLSLQLGNRGARFDGPGVLRALRSRVGRLKVGASLALAVRRPFHVESRGREKPRSRPGRLQRLAAAAEAPSRPSAAPGRENGSYGV